MKRIVSIFFSFLILKASAQKDVASLTESLTRNCTSDKQKLTAIFRWITQNISYTTFTRQQRPSVSATETEPDDDGPLKPLNERVAESVLKRRTAFCDGYARLLATMCAHASIRCEIICGYANGGSGKAIPKFGVNHYWNAVWLDGKWQLLDATWASGYLDMRTGEFVNSFDDRYYLSSPDTFIRDHYPDDPRWTLLPDNKVPDEFRQSPFRQRSFAKYGFTSFSPGKGIIEARVGDTIVLQLEREGMENISVSHSELTDSTLFSYSSSWVFLSPDLANTEPAAMSRHLYTYPVTKPDVQWLYLLYNDDVVMRYKINIRPRP